MKASSVGLEANVHLSIKEIFDLRCSPVKGVLRFREVNGEKIKDIPITIQTNLEQKEFLDVGILPKKTYFGNALEIIYTVNNEFYENLVERGFWGDRYLKSGKLIIYCRKH